MTAIDESMLTTIGGCFEVRRGQDAFDPEQQTMPFVLSADGPHIQLQPPIGTPMLFSRHFGLQLAAALNRMCEGAEPTDPVDWSLPIAVRDPETGEITLKKEI